MIHRMAAAALLLGTLSFGAHGADQAAECEQQAAQQQLTGGVKASFVRKCIEDATKANCEAQAGERKLEGAEHRNFVSKCARQAESESSRKVCEAQADQQNLSGAKRSTFITTCIADRRGSG